MHVPVSCRLSAAGVRFSVIRFPPRDWAFLAVGLPGKTFRPDLDGVTAFRTHELRPGWVPSIPRGRWCSPGRVASPTGTRRFPAASPSIPPTTSHRRSPLHEASNEGSRHSPVRSSPRPRPGMEPAALRLPPELRTLPSPATHVEGGDRPSSTDLELPLNSHPSISNPVVHSMRATSRRTASWGSLASAADPPCFRVRADIVRRLPDCPPNAAASRAPQRRCV